MPWLMPGGAETPTPIPEFSWMVSAISRHLLIGSCQIGTANGFPKSKDICTAVRRTSLLRVRRIWADPTACLLFCASVVIASNNFDSALPRLSGRDVTESDYRPSLPGVGCLLLANEREFRVKKPDATTAELMAEFNQ